MVRERSMSKYISTAVDSAGLIVMFNKVDTPMYAVWKMLSINYCLRKLFYFHSAGVYLV